MENKFCKVIIENGVQFLAMPNGEKIPGIQLTRISQDVEQSRVKLGHALVKMVVVFDNDTGFADGGFVNDLTLSLATGGKQYEHQRQ